MLDINESWVSRGKWIIPESHSTRAIGMSTDKEHDKYHYAQVYVIVHEDQHKRHTEAEVTERLLDCVNACAGMSDPEAHIKLLEDNSQEAGRYKKQRDELLAALKEARRWIGDGDMSDDATAIHHWSAGYAKAIADTDAAIARAESKVYSFRNKRQGVER